MRAELPGGRHRASALVVYLVSMTLGESLTSGEIAHEVVRTLVGSIGLVLAIPLTTALAAATVGTLDGAGTVADEDVDRAGPPERECFSFEAGCSDDTRRGALRESGPQASAASRSALPVLPSWVVLVDDVDPAAAAYDD